jgi:hypothetical protein
VKSWVEQKKTMTQDKIVQWKEKRDVKRVGAGADLAEHYAAAGVDEAERAAVEAVVGRMDANGVQAPTASKSA